MKELHNIKPIDKNFDTPTARVSTLRLQNQIDQLSPGINVFIEDLKNAYRAADGNYILTDPTILESLRELNIAVSTAIVYAGMASNGADNIHVRVDITREKPVPGNA
jgi:hypothetical protein